ncbi:class I SAM-dependent methyltransferase [Nocardioides zeae]|uniref:Class I SAM-dependent methyltransferase n=1 Tax=Nocardioides imazamoxiresistens TaxID=3231893 RepID=A0ABU3Q0B3_9ACTN|nr:class I SAM-dependent methyltransferase [Nocardioides zeae]MDT9594561.1 class I SAM-dependent methyltransferase [Nocardioides zeae]
MDEETTRRANRSDWDRHADDYQAEHGAFLGDAGFVWGPEGLAEDEAGLLGDVAGRRVLDLGCGAAQCARWVRERGGEAYGLDLSFRQLQHARRIDDDRDAAGVPLVHATATRLPFADRVFDVVLSSYGALQFVADADALVAEVARTLRPGGRFAFSVTHPVRWSFPDDPGPAGLVAATSYWDRRPYVETDPQTGEVTYAEHHRTLGDWVRLLARHGFRLDDLVEPEWPESNDRVWAGWSPTRGRVLPGTAVFVATVR